MSTWIYQTVFAGAVMVPVGFVLILSMGGVYDGGVSLLGYVLVPAIASFLLISTVSILGLPLRLVPGWRKWWRGTRGLSLLVAGLGLLVVVLSRVFATAGFASDEFGDLHESFVPQPMLLLVGSIVLAFGLVHTWFRREPALPDEPARLDRGPRDG